MKAWRPAPVGANTFLVRMEPQPDGNLKGMVDGPAMSGPVPFSSLSRLILLLDNQMDLKPGPAALRPPSCFMRPNVQLEILFRQNYSWQGKLRWLDTKREQSFRSVLELVLILEALFV